MLDDQLPLLAVFKAMQPHSDDLTKGCPRDHLGHRQSLLSRKLAAGSRARSPCVPRTPRMPQYRLYSLDREHKVNSSSDGDFRSDDEAMAHAYELATICPGVEVWCGMTDGCSCPKPRFKQQQAPASKKP